MTQFRTMIFGGALFLCMLIEMLGPDTAFAWGPGVHAVTGNWLLSNLSLLSASAGALLARHGTQFLYGIQSPDFFIGKGSKKKKGHSHNWESGFALLSKAISDAEHAFALGYLAHLAEDTVAHNVFVPGLWHTVQHVGPWTHVYLEAQADCMLPWRSSGVLRTLRAKGGTAASRMLSATLRHPPLSLWAKKQIYQSGVAVGGSRFWKKSLRLADAFVGNCERRQALRLLMTISAAAMVDILRHRMDSTLLTLDPIGAQALAQAKHARSSLLATDVPERWLLREDETRGMFPDIWIPESRVALPDVLRTIAGTIPEAREAVRLLR